MHFTEVEYKNDTGYPALLFKHSSQGPDDPDEYWEMPFEAIGNRTELYGLESVEQAIEFLAQEVNQPENGEKFVGDVTFAYTDVINAEFAQSLMPNPVADGQGERQTVLNRLSIGSDKRTVLKQARERALKELGLRTPATGEPSMRVASTQEAQGAAGKALNASNEIISRACAIAEEHRNELEAWRLETPLNLCSQLRETMETEARRMREAGRQAGLKGEQVNV